MRWAPAVLLSVMISSASAADEDVATIAATGFPSTVLSATQRFIATGMSSSENLAFTVAAEEAAGKLESVVGLPLPFGRRYPVQLIGRSGNPGEPGRVIRAQGWVDRDLVQKLIVVNPERADQEDVLEGLCWLLLNRYVAVRQDIRQRNEGLGESPDWLSVGVAQNLYHGLRARNSKLVVDKWRQNASLSLAEILDFEHLPEGRWMEKAFCGMSVGFIASKGSALFDSLFERMANGERIGADWLCVQLTGVESLREMEKHWDVWIAQQTQIKRALGAVGMEQVDRLRDSMVFAPDEMGIAGENIPQSMSFADLVDLRNEEWMPRLANVLSLKVQSLGLGEGPELRKVLDAYCAYLESLRRRRFFRRRSDKEVRALLAHADECLEELEARLSERSEGADGSFSMQQDARMERAMLPSVRQRLEAQRRRELEREMRTGGALP